MTMGGEDRCTFDFVRPGTYRASLDGKQWRTITIDSMPAEQTFDLRRIWLRSLNGYSPG